MEKLVMDVREFQNSLGISRPMAYKLVNQDGFPKLRIGRKILIPRDSFMRWMEEHTKNGGSIK